MNDTRPEIAQKIIEMIQEKTPEERALMGSSMYATSRYLVTQGILNNNPNISPLALRQKIFLTFYGDEFTESERKKILNYLSQKE